jgi:hypothetical protein
MVKSKLFAARPAMEARNLDLARPSQEPGNLPGSRQDEEKSEDLSEPQFDQHLVAEIMWNAHVLDHFLLEVEREFLTPAIVERTVSEGLAFVGLVVRDESAAGTVLKLDSGYERHGVLLVRLFSMLEIIPICLAEGYDLETSLNEALKMNNWRQVTPLPEAARPVVRKAQRMFPIPLVRRIPPDLFWFLSMPRLVEVGFIAPVPTQDRTTEGSGCLRQ